MKEPGFERQAEGVFINNNEKELAMYRSHRARAYREREHSQRIEKLEQELQQIKQLLQKHIVAQRKD